MIATKVWLYNFIKFLPVVSYVIHTTNLMRLGRGEMLKTNFRKSFFYGWPKWIDIMSKVQIRTLFTFPNDLSKVDWKWDCEWNERVVFEFLVFKFWKSKKAWFSTEIQQCDLHLHTSRQPEFIEYFK